MPVDYANGLCEPASCFRIPRSSKIPNPFLADLNRVWLTCFHISQEQEERKKDTSFLSNKELWTTPICRVLTKISCVWNRLPIISSLPALARSARAAEQRAFQPTHWPYITRWVAKPTCSFGRRPPHCQHLLWVSQGSWAADCSSALLRALVFTREIWGIMKALFRTFNFWIAQKKKKTLQTERNSPLFLFYLNIFYNRPRCFP